MRYEDLVRRSADFWLRLIGLFCMPLQALASGPASSREDPEKLRDEVWAVWADQEPPIEEVVFR